MKNIDIAGLTIGNDCPLTIIAGPCQLETADHARMIAGALKEACDQAGAQFVFKASYDKANRTSLSGKRGLGIDEGLKVLDTIRSEFGVPVLTDVHTEQQCAVAAEAVDILQIPAFLCRQTDMLLAAGRTGKAVNIKKGQFIAPWDMELAVQKVRSAGCEHVLLTERGTCFGYNRLVSDLRAIPQMQQFAPVVFDATHSVQEPGGLGTSSGGQREYAPLLALGALAAGADGLFMETHPQPQDALSDAASQIPLDEMEELLGKCLAIFRAARGG